MGVSNARILDMFPEEARWVTCGVAKVSTTVTSYTTTIIICQLHAEQFDCVGSNFYCADE